MALQLHELIPLILMFKSQPFVGHFQNYGPGGVGAWEQARIWVFALNLAYSLSALDLNSLYKIQSWPVRFSVIHKVGNVGIIVQLLLAINWKSLLVESIFIPKLTMLTWSEHSTYPCILKWECVFNPNLHLLWCFEFTLMWLITICMSNCFHI